MIKLNDDYEIGFDSNSFKADITQGLLKNEFIPDKFKREYQYGKQERVPFK